MQVNADRVRRRIAIRVDGFVDLKAMGDAETAMLKAACEARGIGDRFDCMVLLGRSAPVAREATETLQGLLGRLRALGLRRVAHVGFSPLARSQIRRLTANDPAYQFFDDEAGADEWLQS